MKKKNCAIFEIVCYVVAAVLGIAALYMAYENFAYINEYAAAYGMSFADLGGQAIQSIVSAFVPYFAYAFIVLGIGRIYHQVTAPKCEVCEESAAEIAEPAEVVAEEIVEEVVEETEEAPVAEPCCECCESCEAPEETEAPVAEATEEPKED